MAIPETNFTVRTDRQREASALRDHFATIALTQIIASKPHETAEKKALEAYQIADSMMRQRGRSEMGLHSRFPTLK